MLSKLFSTLVVLFAVVSTVVSSPVNAVSLASHRAGISFNNWGHLSSLANFDNFYGRDNFIGSISRQKFIEQDRHLVCRTQSVEIVQQRLLVIQEMAKRILTEQVCDVETQTIVFEQFHSSLGLFRRDLRRTSGHRVGFDRSISNHFRDVVQVDGSLTNHNFGFSGHDLGRNYVVFGGSNWNDRTSPASVFSAYSAAHQAINRFH
ncbi:hypothetical protein BDN70DRAFT_873867 [Pholiota conissans]|uniref:Uncharacterized protein n=1 Tax=Pholiota conissans TaxID=109636 RepID=A0A9P6D582_9AGAR|nr:hypothetical protein BDN70DRAFT_873867 [Pholiota conissans]